MLEMRSRNVRKSVSRCIKGVTTTALLCFLSPVVAGTLNGVVVGISDGDTLKLLEQDSHEHKIRLQGIDAPEKRQPWGRRSTQNLAALAFNKAVVAECGKVDRYARKVCKILVDGQDIGLAQIKAGMAWWYRSYATEQSPNDSSAYESAEASAKATRVGLWNESSPQPPWEWRRAHRVQR